ncbi:MAG: ATP-binding protein, partial [Rhodospirillaceae bacterium]
MTHTPVPMLYNQDTLADDDFVANFVARPQELDTLLRRLRSISPEESGQHHLVIGVRGMGKSSMLRRIAIAIAQEPALSDQFIPLKFREEQYNILSLGTFWRNCGEALAEWAEATGQDDLAARLDDAMATAAWAGDEAPAEQFAAELRALERRAVLLLDNLDLILSNLKPDDHWTLRRYLQDTGGPVVVGASPQALSQSADRDAAFYEFFQPMYLEPLDGPETERCMRFLATERGEAGKPVLH